MMKKQCIMVMIVMCYTIVGASFELPTVGRTLQNTRAVVSTRSSDYDDLVMCLDDEYDEFERLDQAPHHWTRWIACKEAFKAFYALVMTKMRTLYCMCTCTKS